MRVTHRQKCATQDWVVTHKLGTLYCIDLLNYDEVHSKSTIQQGEFRGVCFLGPTHIHYFLHVCIFLFVQEVTIIRQFLTEYKFLGRILKNVGRR